MRRAKRKWGAYGFMIKDDGVSFDNQKERDTFHSKEIPKVVNKPRSVGNEPLFNDHINHLIAIGKVKVYYSLTDFKNR